MEFKFISEFHNEIFFSFRNKKYVGITLEEWLADNYRSSGRYHLYDTMIDGELPDNLEGVNIQYQFEENDYQLKWICYFNSQPSESDEEIMSDIYGYVMADMPNIGNKDIAFHFEERYLHQPLPKILTPPSNWIYLNPKCFPVRDENAAE